MKIILENCYNVVCGLLKYTLKLLQVDTSASRYKQNKKVVKKKLLLMFNAR